MAQTCENCKHRRADPDGDSFWDYCARPNYPKGVRCNRLLSVQRRRIAAMDTNVCAGKFWEPVTSEKDHCPNLDEACAVLHGHACDAPDKDNPDHECVGVLTITRTMLKADCPKCGSCKMMRKQNGG